MTAPAATLADLEAAGVRLWPEGGALHYRAPGKLTAAQTAAVVAHKPALLVLLATWDAPAARRLAECADAEVERCGACGADEAIQRLAGEWLAAMGAEDMPGVRKACAMVEERARKVAAHAGRRAA